MTLQYTLARYMSPQFLGTPYSASAHKALSDQKSATGHGHAIGCTCGPVEGFSVGVYVVLDLNDNAPRARHPMSSQGHRERELDQAEHGVTNPDAVFPARQNARRFQHPHQLHQT